MQDNVGTIVIGTKVNTAGIKKGLQDTEKLIDRYSGDRNIGLNLINDEEYVSALKRLQSLEREREKLDEQGAKYTKSVQEQFAGEGVSITGLDLIDENLTGKYQDILDNINAVKYSIDVLEIKEKERLADLEKQTETLKEQKNITKQMTGDVIITDNGLKLVKKQQEEATQNMGLNLKRLEKGFGNIKNGLSTMLKKVLKIGMALVGVRTIINLITRSFNTLASYNEELGSKVEQMRLVLAVAFEPIINWLINALHVILSLINQIYSAVFGINLFGRASELWSKKMAKNLGGASSSAKELKKQLAGFDEMNVLQDPSASSGGGGVGGGGITPWTLEPTFDWGKIDTKAIVEKAKEIVKNLITGLNEWLKNVDPQELADGISTLIKGLLDIATMTFTEIDWQQLGKVLIETLSKMDWVGIIQSLINNIIGSLTWPIDLLLGLIDGLVEFFSQPDCLDKMLEAGITLVTALAKGLWTLLTKIAELGAKIIVAVIMIVVSLGVQIWEKIKEGASQIWGWLKGAFEKAWEWIKGLFQKMREKFDEFKTKIHAMIQTGVDWINSKIEYVKSIYLLVISVIKEKINEIKQWFKDKIQAIVDGIKEKIEAVKTGIHNVVEWIKEKFEGVKNFFKGIGIAIGDFFSSSIKGAVNGVLGWVEEKVNWFIDKINGVIGLINKIPGVNIPKMGRISLPRLASGGIINQPGRGVPVGGAIAGESGREGILPLTDRQAMAELGREIGKWISIQATVPVNIGNRQVARVIQELNNDREFATNS